MASDSVQVLAKHSVKQSRFNYEIKYYVTQLHNTGSYCFTHNRFLNHYSDKLNIWLFNLFFFLLSFPCRVFGFVAKKPGSMAENVCHLFAELDPEQPASAIVNFINKVMLAQRR